MVENEYKSSQAVTADEDISLNEIISNIGVWWRYIVSKWLIILSLALLGGLCGVLYAIFMKPIYTAETTFVLEDDNESGGMLGQLGGLAGMAGIDIGGGGGGLFQGDNIIELYKSRSMIQKTLLSEVRFAGTNQLLIDRYIQINDLRTAWEKKPELRNLEFKGSSGEFSRIQDSILGITIKRIKADFLSVTKPDKKLSIINVSVKSNDEFFAKAFNDQIVKNVNDFYVQTKTKKALENLAILQNQTDSVRNVLNGAIYQTAAVTDGTPNLNPARQTLRTPALRSQFNAEANKAILTQLIQNLELAKLSLRKETPLIQIIDEPIFPLQKSQVGKVTSFLIGTIAFGFIAMTVLIAKRIIMRIVSKQGLNL